MTDLAFADCAASDRSQTLLAHEGQAANPSPVSLAGLSGPRRVSRHLGRVDRGPAEAPRHRLAISDGQPFRPEPRQAPGCWSSSRILGGSSPDAPSTVYESLCNFPNVHAPRCMHQARNGKWFHPICVKVNLRFHHGCAVMARWNPRLPGFRPSRISRLRRVQQGPPWSIPEKRAAPSSCPCNPTQAASPEQRRCESDV
jgi:hypothetical protein